VIDWWRVIVDLERRGVSHADIGAACRRSEKWATVVKNLGHEPRHDDGESLISLWLKTTRRPRRTLPTRRDPAPMDGNQRRSQLGWR
jgi:hypothetical protein